MSYDSEPKKKRSAKHMADQWAESIERGDENQESGLAAYEITIRVVSEDHSVVAEILEYGRNREGYAAITEKKVFTHEEKEKVKKVSVDESEKNIKEEELYDALTCLDFLGNSRYYCKSCKRKTVLEGYTCCNCGHDNSVEEEEVK